jgi:RNA polymerase sigma-70 factor (ECF subfamily)
VFENLALNRLDRASSGETFSEFARETQPTPDAIVAFSHPSEQLSETTFEDVGLPAIQKQATEHRWLKAAQTDEVLFEKIARDRNQAAYSEFYDRYSPRIYALLLHMLRAEEEAQDLLQEVFVLVWQKAPQFLESRGNLVAWVMSLARNRAVDELRSRRYRDHQLETDFPMVGEDRPEIDHLLVETKTPDMGLHAADAQREVRKALKELSNDQRSIVDMAYFGGLTHVEIAARLEMPVGTVKTKMRQAVMKMGRVLRHKF